MHNTSAVQSALCHVPSGAVDVGRTSGVYGFPGAGVGFFCKVYKLIILILNMYEIILFVVTVMVITALKRIIRPTSSSESLHMPLVSRRHRIGHRNDYVTCLL